MAAPIERSEGPAPSERMLARVRTAARVEGIMWPMARAGTGSLDDADPRTRLALLRQFYRDSHFSLFAAVLLVAWHVAYLRSTGTDTWWLPWVAYCAALITLRAAWRRAILRCDDAELAVTSPRWTRRAVAGAAATGLMWAAGMLMAFDARDSVSQMYCATLACLTCVGSINVMAPLPRAFHALVLPVALTLAALFAAAGNLAGYGQALLVLIAAMMATGLMRHHARLLNESLGLRHEREATLAQLEQAVAARTRFLAAASHDLRQPLHALGLLAAEARAELEGRSAARTAERIEEMVQALDALVDALMDISRIDSNAITVALGPVALGPLLERVVADFADQADLAGLRLRLRPTDAWVVSDGLHLERIVRNLLSNALRYTREGGVLVGARARHRDGVPEMTLEVWDTGCGIAEADRARVFDEFVQLGNPERQRALGLGLGLSIVQRLAQRLEHRVEVRSRPGRGSCFAVSMATITDAHAARSHAEQARSAGIPSLAGLVVWLVEDDPDVRTATARLLERWGCAVASSMDGDGLASPPAPSCLVCDWRLPGARNGLEVIRALRAALPTPLRALLISGEALPTEVHAEARDAGIDVARKPLTPARLRAWLASDGLPSPPGDARPTAPFSPGRAPADRVLPAPPARGS